MMADWRADIEDLEDEESKRSLGAVAWAVPPGTKSYTRPVKLVDAMSDLGNLGELRFIHHGSARTSAKSIRASGLHPCIPASIQDSNLAVMSPVFDLRGRTPLWVDLYDDWSLAPDQNAVRRLQAGYGYRHVRRLVADPRRSCLVTVNSHYMAAKLGLAPRYIVPNGVEPELASFRLGGDCRTRMLVLGHFFSSRTDFHLIRRFATADWISEVIVGGPGTDKSMVRLLKELREVLGDRLTVIEWLSAREIADIAGKNTFALIPNVESDYTVSQDPLKSYMFSALGIRVVCPHALWPKYLDQRYAFLLGPGAESTECVREWLEERGPSMRWRSTFTECNTWAARASQISDLLGGSR